ncbi:MAG: MBL fold metallo-hydrolase [Nanoarchaeota archaeon]|nr:MBL fold metallo-hydrolase [Nanoarchaeota archaeon]
MTSLTFYGGTGEIGGNKFLLKDKGANIYLDFGESFTFGQDFFYNYLSPRTVNGLEVYFEFNMIPKISGLYNKDMLKATNLKYQKPNIQAVFISHSHSDHAGHLSFIDEDIPVYMGHCTHKLIDVYTKLYKSFQDIGTHNNLKEFKSGDKIKIKHLEITPIHVEHSVPGAYGFIIKTSKGNIVYTGDFRMHGPRADLTKEFIKKARDSKPIAMLCEGTRMSSDVEHNYTEEEVEKKVNEITKASKGTVFGHFAMSNVDRFMSFYKACIKNKRIMVIDTRFALILESLKEHISILPDVRKDKNIKVYFRIAKTCTFQEKDYSPWEREYMKNMITYKEIKKNPKKYLMHMRFAALMEMVYLQPKSSDFIYSSSEHFYEGEENLEERTIWENWMKHFKITFHKAHCSGHADKAALTETIKTINPKVLIPIHTQVPEEFKKLHKNVILPVKNKTIEL